MQFQGTSGIHTPPIHIDTKGADGIQPRLFDPTPPGAQGPRQWCSALRDDPEMNKLNCRRVMRCCIDSLEKSLSKR